MEEMSEAVRQRHLKNRDDLLAARETLLKQWEAEDAQRDADRKGHLAAFDRGVADFHAATGLEEPAEPVPGHEDRAADPPEQPAG